ncbi:hypothetical protein [Mesorhizobium sp.]|uniref:hypothetical protein n=1 Tax=Mesorhizobium sp. TaxID=1871066 RepID=UPI000FE4E78D|nr:hypothetical protein [Mesorhizobium sp.]RWG39428.1 MAG: hypothetical protein EOQ62_31415 [Mesorhizobium sp.]RWJ33208.1 MAG: hypothetical protein EOR28_11525 [Mesorhizobium sp.]TIQ64420.1 MAG: hypothetical protein E5X41_17315 [Mesorhizobium sp.]TIQ71847.1 MAG: hypothetical protein E5X40_14385 [Mesorhizobium sp.]
MTYGLAVSPRYKIATLDAGDTIVDLGSPDPFPVIAATDVKVFRTRAGVRTPLVLDVDYAVSLLNQLPGARVTLAAGALQDDIVEVVGERPIARPTDLNDGQKFSEESLNAEFDALTIEQQEARRDINRAVASPLGEAGLEMPAFAAGKALAWDTVQRKLVNTIVSPGDITDAIEQAEAFRDQTETFRNESEALRNEAQDWAIKVTDVTPGNPSAKTSADLAALRAAAALVSETNADISADLAQSAIGGVIFDTTAAGIAGTVNGQVFIVKGAGITSYYKNVAGVATFIDAYVGLLQTTSAIYDYILKDPTGRINYAVRKDGEGVVSKLEVLNRLRTWVLEARKIEFRRGGTAAVDAAFIEPRSGVPGLGLTDIQGRQAVRMDAGGVTAPGLVREMEFHSRGRSAGSATHIVRSRRRSVTSRNFDLYSINVSTGAEVKLTTDATDRWDFCDPAIFGSNCMYTRRAGGVQQLFVRPLDGSAPAKQALPDKFLVANGDSLVNNTFITKLAEFTGLPLVDISLGGTSFAQQVAFLAAKPLLWSGILVMWEGGINPEPDIPNQVIAKIQDQVNMLTPFFKRWLILEPSPGITYLGSPGRQVGNPAHYDAQVAAIAAAFPNNFVPTLEVLQANNNGSAQDLADVAGDAVPSSLMDNPPTDTIHLNVAGATIGASCGSTAIINRGWN